MPTKYLMTGGAGFVGSHLAEELLGRGTEVQVIDDLSTGTRMLSITFSTICFAVAVGA